MDNYTVFSGFFIYVTIASVVLNWRPIAEKFYDVLILSPGKGRVRTKTIRKKKLCYVETNYGDVNIPLLKMHDFDMVFGFFDQNLDYPEGMSSLETFKKMFYNFPKYTSIPTYDTYWLCHYKKPSDVFGRKKITGFVLSHIDDVIFTFTIRDDENIDYEKFYKEYLDQIVDFEPDEIYQSVFEEESTEKNCPVEEESTEKNCPVEEESTEKNCPVEEESTAKNINFVVL